MRAIFIYRVQVPVYFLFFKCILTLTVYLNLALSPVINNFWNSAYTQIELTGGNSSFSLTVLDDPDCSAQSHSLHLPFIRSENPFHFVYPSFSGWFQKDKRNESGDPRKPSNKRKLWWQTESQALLYKSIQNSWFRKWKRRAAGVQNFRALGKGDTE